MILIKWLSMALTVLAIPHLISGFEVRSLGTALALALVLGVFNLVLKPVLIFLTFPFTLFSFGFFLLFINAFVFWLSAQFVSGVYVEDFGSAFWASVLLSLINLILSVNKKRFSFTRRPSSKNTIDLDQDSTGKWVS